MNDFTVNCNFNEVNFNINDQADYNEKINGIIDTGMHIGIDKCMDEDNIVCICGGNISSCNYENGISIESENDNNFIINDSEATFSI